MVSNDNGGGIFELLEQGDPRFSDVSSRIFGTPHDVDVGRCAARTTSRPARSRSPIWVPCWTNRTTGMRVLEVKADRSSLRELHAAIKAAL